MPEFEPGSPKELGIHSPFERARREWRELHSSLKRKVEPKGGGEPIKIEEMPFLSVQEALAAIAEENKNVKPQDIPLRKKEEESRLVNRQQQLISLFRKQGGLNVIDSQVNDLKRGINGLTDISGINNMRTLLLDEIRKAGDITDEELEVVPSGDPRFVFIGISEFVYRQELNKLMGLLDFQEEKIRTSSPNNPFERLQEAAKSLEEAARRQSEIIEPTPKMSGALSVGEMLKILSPEALSIRGFGKVDIRESREFGNGQAGVERWLTAIYSGLWGTNQILDENIYNFCKNHIDSRYDLSPSQKDRLKKLSQGLFFIHNYRLAWMGSNGEIQRFTKTTDEGGVISSNEKERLEMDHFIEQCRLYPGMLRALVELDDWAAKAPANCNELPTVHCQGYTRNQIGLSDAELDSVVEYQKALASSWFKLLGFMDIRNFQAKLRQYATDLPGEVGGDFRRFLPVDMRSGSKYNRAVSFTRWQNEISPYSFLMDPLSLFGNVQQKSPDLISWQRVRAKCRANRTGHLIFSLGWRPPAWEILEILTGEIPGSKLGDYTLKSLGDGGKSLVDIFENAARARESGQVDNPDLKVFERISNYDLQKAMIKNAAKAGLAQESLAKCLVFSNHILEDMGELLNKIASYNRDIEPGRWGRQVILPMAVDFVVVTSYYAISVRRGDRRILPIKRSVVRGALGAINEYFAPTPVLSKEVIEFFLNNCDDAGFEEFATKQLANFTASFKGGKK